MRSFLWTSAKSVFVPELDAEHRNLHSLARDVQLGVNAGVPASLYMPRLRTLLAAAEDHFVHEERMMRQAHYRLLKWHVSQHDSIRKRAADDLARIEEGDSAVAAEFLQFFATWLGAHLGVADRMMAAALRAHSRLHAA